MGGWAVWLDLILKFLAFLSEKRKNELKAKMAAAVKKIEVGADDDAEGNTYVAIRAALNKTPILKVRERNFLRWALQTVPDAAGAGAKTLPKSAVGEGKSLAADLD